MGKVTASENSNKMQIQIIDTAYFIEQASSPACTELEILVMNWLGKMIGLPEAFLHTHNESKGGGVIQVSTFDTIWLYTDYIILC